MRVLDCRGLNCPEPVLRAKAALEESREAILVEVDNPASRDNVIRFGKSQGCSYTSTAIENSCFRIELTPSASGGARAEDIDASAYSCEVPASSGLIYIIASDTMGRGSDELGWALLQTYIATIREVSPLPDKIFFYNGGVRIVATEGKALEAVQYLEKKGVEVYSCGTCLEFFKLEKELKVGKITNMYDILDSMSRAAKVVSPY